MSRFRKIDPKIWNDSKFMSLSERAKLAFLMVLTHPNMTAFGAMRATAGGLADELGCDAEAFREAFEEVVRVGLVERDPVAPFIAAPNFIRYNTPESPNVIKAWVGAFDLLPECDLKTLTLQRARAFSEGMSEGFRKAFEGSFGKTIGNKEKGERRLEKGFQSYQGEQTSQDRALRTKAGAGRPLAVVNGGFVDGGEVGF